MNEEDEHSIAGNCERTRHMTFLALGVGNFLGFIIMIPLLGCGKEDS